MADEAEKPAGETPNGGLPARLRPREVAEPRPAVPPDMAIGRREHDFVMLVVFVFLQHRLYERASALVEGLLATGMEDARTVLARAVLAFCRGEHQAALDALSRLDRLDPIERYKGRLLTDRERMRSYLRARSLFELGAGERQAIELYIRHRDGAKDRAKDGPERN